MEKLSRFPHLASAIYFKNFKRDAGATLAHPHAQIIALPMVPKRLAEELTGATRYFTDRSRCVFCDIIAAERERGVRMVAETDSFAVIVPYASRSPFELMILPRRHAADFHAMQETDSHDLACCLADIFRRMKGILGEAPFNYYLHTAPFRSSDTERKAFHWHIELAPSLSRIAGFELASGFYINPYAPETCAAMYRELR
jgi:UDPglucose--hexose-1-phosphate uridylyltransferase